MGGLLPPALAVRQKSPLHPRRQLHRLLLLGRLRQERYHRLGNPAHGLPLLRQRFPQPRAPRLPARRHLLLVHLQPGASEAPADALDPARALARGPGRPAGPGRRLAQHRSRRIQAHILPGRTRQRRFRAGDLGRSGDPRGRISHPHHPDPRTRPHLRLHADPGHVHGVLRLRGALSVADRRGAGELLRLVLRPAAGIAPGVGRADRCAGERRLVRILLHDRLGHQPAHDAHARRPLLHGGPLPRRQGGRRGPGLRRVRQVRRHLAAGQGGHGCRARHGHEPRDPEGILHRAPERLFQRLRRVLHRPAVCGRAGRTPG